MARRKRQIISIHGASIAQGGRAARFPYSPAERIFRADVVPFESVTVNGVSLLIAVSKITNQVAICKDALLMEA